MNCVWVIAFINHLHVWVTKSKPSLMFFQIPILTSNNVVWASFFAVVFDETQHVIKISTTKYVPVYYEIVHLFFFFFLRLLMPWYSLGLNFNHSVKLFQFFWQDCFYSPSQKWFCFWYFTPQERNNKDRVLSAGLRHPEACQIERVFSQYL